MALEHAKQFVVSDYRSNGKITHHFDEHVVEQERITSVFAFPVQVGGRVEGILYGASRDACLIGDVALRRAAGVASKLAAEVGRLELTPLPVPLLTSAHALTEIEAVTARIVDPTLRARLAHAHRSLTAIATPHEPLPAAIRLAPSEEQCLALAATGATNSQIADDLGLSAETVKAYLRSAMRRLKVSNRTAAVHVARAAGLL